MKHSFKASQIAPTAWWLLGLSLAICAGITSNPITLLIIQVASVLIIGLAREEASWSRSLRFYLVTGAFVVLIRLIFRVTFNYDSPGDVAIFLPAFKIPFGVLGEINLFGRVSHATLVAAFRDGLRLSAIILSIGLANSLANPRKLLKNMPSALYGVTSAFVIALNLAPQLITSAKRIRLSSQLRNESHRPSNLLVLIGSILEDSIDRSMALAASMDARGFGRRGTQTDRQLLLSRVSAFSAVSALAIGAYLLLSTELTWVSIACFSLAITGVYVSLKLAENANLRSRYNRQSWRVKDSVIAGISTVLVALFICGVIK